MCKIGESFRRHYIDVLKFMPEHLGDPHEIYVRSTHIERAVVSAQRFLDGFFPAAARSFPFVIVQCTA